MLSVERSNVAFKACRIIRERHPIKHDWRVGRLVMQSQIADFHVHVRIKFYAERLNLIWAFRVFSIASVAALSR